MRRALGLTALAVVVIEVLLLWLVGHYLGAIPTFLLVVLGTVIGVVLVKREGARAWQSLRTTVQAGGSPDTQIVDGALVLLGGALMILPGFLTDLIGLLLLIAPVRRLGHRPLGNLAARFTGAPQQVRARRVRNRPAQPYDEQSAPRPAARVIDAERLDRH